MTISHTGTFVTGILYYTGTGAMTFTNGATCPGGGSSASFVNGPVIKIGANEFYFPTGNVVATTEVWAPLKIAAPTKTTDKFTCQYFYASPATRPTDPISMCNVSSLNHVSTTEYWAMTRDVATTSAPAVTLYWYSPVGVNHGIFVPSSLLVSNWSGSCWESKGITGVTGNASAGSITSSSAFTTYNTITFGSKDLSNPLPISLLDFTAQCADNGVDINWSTATETNNDHFDIERSIDALNWQSIASVKGAGNSNEILNYSLKDADAKNGISYYRLRQTDFDGKNTVFDPVAVTCYSAKEKVSVNYYPNPFTSEIAVEITNLTSGYGLIRVFNTMGSQVFSKLVSREELDQKTVTLNLSDLPAGIYMVEFSSNTFSKTGEIVKR